METIGYGLIQIPLVTKYKVCCITRTLAGGVTSTGWQEILSSTLRIVLLSSWGLQSIDYSLPQTAEKIVGVYIELFILSLQVFNGIIILFGLWMNKMFLLYPTFVIIPACFLTDIIIKGSCYGALFLTPRVTVFGVFSLIEVWFKGLCLMYGWIIVISFVYYKRKDCTHKPIDVELSARSPGRVSTIHRNPSHVSGKSPFSRHSTLSRKGRNSFLLRSGSRKVKAEDRAAVLNLNNEKLENEENNKRIAKGEEISSLTERYSADLNTESIYSANNNSLRNTSDIGKDYESEILLGESATMSLKRSPGPKTGNGVFSSSNSSKKTGSLKRYVPPALQSPAKYKKRGGFVPEILRTPSMLEQQSRESPLPEYPPTTRNLPIMETSESLMSDTTTTANTIEFGSSINYRSNSDQEQERLLDSTKSSSISSKRSTATPGPKRGPPTLPRKPPVGPPKHSIHLTDAKSWSWVSPKRQQGKQKSVHTAGQSKELLTKHVQDPVLV